MSLWRQVEIGLQEAFEEFRRATQRKPSGEAIVTSEERRRINARPRAVDGLSLTPGALWCWRLFRIVDAAIKSLDTPCPDALALPTLGTELSPEPSQKWDSSRAAGTRRRLLLLPAGL